VGRKTDSLDEYRTKRDFAFTPEPQGEPAPSRGRRFVIQQHRARRLHYDLRLELDGVLVSWAVPKGPSLDPDARQLAVRTEDHPIEYAAFEGVIPKDQYGAGPVLLWDRGTWQPINDPHEGLAKGDLKFRLHGQRLAGTWAIVRIKGRRPGDRDDRNWLLIKKRDDAARPGGPDILEEHPASVASGRTLDEIAADPKRVWSSDDTTLHGAGAASIDGARPAPLPESMRPQLATLASAAPDGDDWIHEIKYDGYRLLCVIDADDIRLITRNGHDWTDRFRPVADAAAALHIDQAILDGEVVVLDERGVPDFQALQNALRSGSPGPLVYYAFDLPHADAYDLTRCALVDRKAALERLIGREGTIRYSEHIRGRGPAVAREACQAGLEGIISKRADAPYQQQRSDTWRKIKCVQADDFAVVGYTRPEGSREGLGALVLAQHDGAGALRYCGRVGTGFDDQTLRDLASRLADHERAASPLAELPEPAETRGVAWTEPILVVEVAYAGRTRGGRLLSRPARRQGPERGRPPRAGVEAARRVARAHGQGRPARPAPRRLRRDRRRRDHPP